MSATLSTAALPFLPKRILLAFSGGLDSRVLFDLLYKSSWVKLNNIELVLVNVNHHTDSTEEALSQFAAKIAETYQVKAHLLHVTSSCPKGESLEAFMRKERYQLFNSLLGEQDILATAHHLDDQAETFLLNLMRGAGLQGLSGMATIRSEGVSYLWRPLLTYSKKDLLAYAKTHALEWCEDPTNKNLSLDRVFLRQQILPLLSERWPKAKEVLARTCETMKATQQALDTYLKADLQNLISNDQALDLKKLKTYPSAQAILLIKAFLDQQNYRLGSAQLQQIYQDFVLTDNDAEPLFEYHQGRLTRRKNSLYFTKINL